MFKTIVTAATGVILGAGLMLAGPGNATGGHPASAASHVQVQVRQITRHVGSNHYCLTEERHRAVHSAPWSLWYLKIAQKGVCAPPFWA